MNTLQVFAPFSGHLIGELPLHIASDVESALSTAHNLFHNRNQWLSKVDRVGILERCIDIMQSRMKRLIKTATEEGGKPWMDTEVEVLRAINGVKLAIETIGTLQGEQIPMGHTTTSQNRMAFTQFEPLGVVLSISAFNHPLNLIIHQTVTAIAAGCPVIVKPALSTPYSCLAFVDILQEAGLPKEWCQVILCNNDLAEKMAGDARIRYLSFIGSAKVGWHLRSNLAPGVHCALEHGGAAPVIVEPDANLTEMLPLMTKGAFYHAGQVCVSVQRVYLHETIAKEVANALVKSSENLIVGDPLELATELGPLISLNDIKRVDSWVKQAVEGGAELLCGGHPIKDRCYAPTILLNPPEDALLSTQEIFGPVLCLYTYSHLDEAIQRANALPFAFQAAVFTKNIDVALNCARRLKATAVMINDHTAFRVDWMPFGGGDYSGIGVGGIKYTIKEMMQEKLVVIRSQHLE